MPQSVKCLACGKKPKVKRRGLCHRCYYRYWQRITRNGGSWVDLEKQGLCQTANWQHEEPDPELPPVARRMLDDRSERK